jgi:hypothetical protein
VAACISFGNSPSVSEKLFFFSPLCHTLSFASLPGPWLPPPPNDWPNYAVYSFMKLLQQSGQEEDCAKPRYYTDKPSQAVGSPITVMIKKMSEEPALQ